MGRQIKAKRGQSEAKMFVCPAGVLADIEMQVIRPVRAVSGYKCNRSRLIQALFKLALDSADFLEPSDVIDAESFTNELRRAISISARAKKGALPVKK